MMRQYQAIKNDYPDCILFFRLGDFYEMFHDDAKVAAKILDIVLTSRHKGENRMPMCGIPFHAAENYIAKLTKAGKKVAICEQTSDPALPGLVKREVIRVITPGTTLNENLLDQKANNYIVSIYPKENYFGLAYADLTTGEFRVTEIPDSESLQAELERLNPRECILTPEHYAAEKFRAQLENFSDLHLYPYQSLRDPYQTLTEFFGTKTLEGFGAEKLPFGAQAAGLLLAYLQETQKTDLAHLQKLSSYSTTDFMALDEATIRNLELVYNLRDGQKAGSLLGVLDQTQTALGGRLLRQWILKPLLKTGSIQNRLEAVEEFTQNPVLFDDFIEQIKLVHDIERILSRLSLNSGNARDLIALKHSLQTIPEIKNLLTGTKSPLLNHINRELTEFNELTELIQKSIFEEPPATLKDGGLIQDNYHSELDELRQLSREGKTFLQNLQAREAKRTGIHSLKVKYNRVFGYYLEISKSNLDSVPDDYIRKQTLVNAERFITPELKEYEEKILTAEDRITDLEYQIFLEIRTAVLKEIPAIQKAARLLAQIDVLLSFAKIALSNHYVKPEITSNYKIEIQSGRHPVVEKLNLNQRFVPNDVKLDQNENRFLLITGPNMAGKSVYLRQVALITLMAHIGCFVPAEKAEISLVDRIFTRVGAADNLIKGQSTFMVEMQETANILNHATEKSLIILDEIGRGTSTYDGVSLAWAITEYIHDKIQAKTLFASHYHELISVIEKLPCAKNLSAQVKETTCHPELVEGCHSRHCHAEPVEACHSREGGNLSSSDSEPAGPPPEKSIVFLYKIKPGGINKSYGIEVARLAGVPHEILSKSKQLLEDLEEGIYEKSIKARLANSKYRITDGQMNLFAGKSSLQAYKSGRLTHPALEALKKIEPEKMTPIEALEKLDELKKMKE